MSNPVPCHLVALIPFLLGACATTDSPTSGLRSCIWVTRFEHRTAADIEQIMSNCASSGFTAVMFQVRGNGTVYYESTRELWSESHGFKSPGFDPLEVAVRSARAHGLEIHAWINLVPGWRGELEKAHARQLVRSRPEWFLSADGGAPEPLEGDYYWLNACNQDVRRYLTSLCFEIAANYQVDGIHLDYVRFPDLPQSRHVEYPGDVASRSAFRVQYGVEPESRPEDFEEWKTTCIDRLVRDVRDSLDTLERQPVLTAAVWRDPSEAPNRLNQDWSRWTEQGLVQAVLPMNYEEDDDSFRALAEEATAVSRGVPVVLGVGVYKHTDPEQTVRQFEMAFDAGAAGVSVFSYSQIFGGEGHDERQRRMAFRQAISEWNIHGQ